MIETQATRVDPVMTPSTPNIASVKKIAPAYMTPAKRLLFESDDNASIVNAQTTTRSTDASDDRGNQRRNWPG